MRWSGRGRERGRGTVWAGEGRAEGGGGEHLNDEAHFSGRLPSSPDEPAIVSSNNRTCRGNDRACRGNDGACRSIYEFLSEFFFHRCLFIKIVNK